MRTTTTYLKLVAVERGTKSRSVKLFVAREGKERVNVLKVIKPWYFRLETLTSSDFSNELSSLSSGFEDVSGHSLPAARRKRRRVSD